MLIQPLVKGFLVNPQASLSQSHDFELRGCFTQTIGLAKADAKDLGYLLGGVCPLNAFRVFIRVIANLLCLYRVCTLRRSLGWNIVIAPPYTSLSAWRTYLLGG